MLHVYIHSASITNANYLNLDSNNVQKKVAIIPGFCYSINIKFTKITLILVHK